MFDFDEAIELALKTWYPKGHSLHLNPHHPLGKLLGEWGELLDDYMKGLYKPGYEFKPLESGELGDIWYYLRILCYQADYIPQLIILSPSHIMQSIYVDFLVAIAMVEAAIEFSNQLEVATAISCHMLDTSFTVIDQICSMYNTTLQGLTDSNWEKLKPGSERGDEWEKARVDTDYVGGKVTKI